MENLCALHVHTTCLLAFAQVTLAGPLASLELQDSATSPATKWALQLVDADLKLVPGTTPDASKEAWFRASTGNMELKQGVRRNPLLLHEATFIMTHLMHSAARVVMSFSFHQHEW